MIYIGEPNFEEDRDDCHPREFKSSFRVAQNILFLGELAPPYSNTKPWWPGKPSYWSILESILRRRWKMYKKDMATDVIVGRVGEIEILREVDVVRRRP